MNKKMKKIISFVVIFCFLIIVFDLVFFLYKRQKGQDDHNYFDSVNAFSETSSGYIGVGSNNDNDQSYEKAKLTKFSGKLKKVWEKFYNHGYNSTFYNVAVDGDAYIAVGRVERNKKEHKNKATSALIVKYNLDGEKLAEKTFGGSSYERYNAIQYFGGSLYVVGSTSSNDSGLRVSSKNGEITAMLIKCDTNLQVTRKDIFGGSNDDNMLDLITDGSNVYMVGYSNSNDSNIKTSHDNGSDFISKLIKVDYRFRILMKK